MRLRKNKSAQVKALAEDQRRTAKSRLGAFEVSLLEVASDSSVSIADGSQFKELNIIFEEDFGTGDTISNFSLSDIFGDTSTIVESALQSHETSLFVTNSSGEEFNASFNEGGQISVGAAVPEASTYATSLDSWRSPLHSAAKRDKKPFISAELPNSGSSFFCVTNAHPVSNISEKLKNFSHSAKKQGENKTNSQERK